MANCKCVLQLGEPGVMDAPLDVLRALRSKDFERLLKEGPLPQLEEPGEAAVLADAAAAGPQSVEASGDVVEEAAPVAPAVPFAAALPAYPVAPDSDLARGCTVRFDGLSHHSQKQQGFATCSRRVVP